MGDDKVDQFLLLWNDLVAYQRVRPSDEELRDFLVDKMRRSKLFVLDLAFFDRAKQRCSASKSDDPDYTYQFLLEALRCHCTEKKDDNALSAFKGIVRNPNKGSGRGNQVAAPAEEKARKKREKSQRRKEKKAKEKADRNSSKSTNNNNNNNTNESAAPAPTTRGRGKDRSDRPNAKSKAKATSKDNWCYFYNSGLRGGKDCNGRCKREHVKVSDAVFNKADPPRRSATQSPARRRRDQSPAAPAEEKGKGKGRGKPDGKRGNSGSASRRTDGKGKSQDTKSWDDYYIKDGKKEPYACKHHLKGEECPHKKAGHCKYPHRSQSQLDKKRLEINKE